MANTKSAKKAARASLTKQAQNKSVRSLAKTTVSKAEKDIFAGNLDAARTDINVAISTLDKAAEKGILHPNNAARRKSRLVKKLNAAARPAPKAEKPA